MNRRFTYAWFYGKSAVGTACHRAWPHTVVFPALLLLCQQVACRSFHSTPPSMMRPVSLVLCAVLAACVTSVAFAQRLTCDGTCVMVMCLFRSRGFCCARVRTHSHTPWHTSYCYIGTNNLWLHSEHSRLWLLWYDCAHPAHTRRNGGSATLLLLDNTCKLFPYPT